MLQPIVRQAEDMAFRSKSGRAGPKRQGSSGAARQGDRQPQPVAEQAAPMLVQAWRGYEEYSRIARPLSCGEANVGGKQRFLTELEDMSATCFWHALVLCLDVKDLSEVFDVLRGRTIDVSEGVSVPEAVRYLIRLGFPGIGVHMHLDTLDGTVEKVSGSSSPSLLYVSCDGSGLGAPHWLPMVRPKRGKAFKPREFNIIPDEALLLMAPFSAVATSEIETPSRTPVVVEAPVDSPEPVGRGTEGPGPAQPPVSPSRPSVWHLNPMRAMPCPLTSPPPPKTGWLSKRGVSESLGAIRYVSGQTPPPPEVGEAYWRGRKGDGYRPGLTPKDWVFGPMAYLKHAQATMMGFSGVELFEMRADLLGQSVRDGALVYSRKGELNPLDPRKYADGAMVHGHVQAILCGTTVYHLTETQTTKSGYEVSTLRLGDGPGYHMPWNRYSACTVREVVLSEVVAQAAMATLDKLPNAVSKIRAVGALVNQVLPEDLVGIFNDVKLEMIGEKNPEECDPIKAAHQLVMLQHSLGQLGGRKAFGHT